MCRRHGGLVRAHTKFIATACILLVACGLDGRKGDNDPGIVSAGPGGALDGGSAGEGGGGSTGAGAGGDVSTGGAGEPGSSGAGETVDHTPKFDIGEGHLDLPAAECQTGANEDGDGDGWTKAMGDCNDCDANSNPGAVEVVVTEPDDMGVVPEPGDEDCDGVIDNPLPSCDDLLMLDDSDPMHAAAAIGLCKVSSGPNDWGIVSANWVRANGTVLGGANQQYGIQTAWGPNVAVREGDSMLVLSSGHARLPGQTGSCNSLTCYGNGIGTAPAGFPQDVPACPGSTAINDDIGLEVTLRVPSNANGFSYDFDFYSFEYPEWVCTSFNDQYIALVNPPPVGSINGNISFDSLGNPVSVNIAFFEVCSGCTLGTGELSGTGFDTWDDAGATSWLVTTAPVDPGTEVTIRFAIWDTGDAAWDSTVLIDNFQWIAGGGDVDVSTEPEG